MHTLFFLLLVPALRAADSGVSDFKGLLSLLREDPVAVAAVLLALPLDVLIAHTTWAAVAGKPQKGEWTISDTLERLASPENNRDENYRLYVELAHKINRLSPTKRHIKVVLNG